MAADPKSPATAAEAEKLAVRLVGEYLTACRMTDRAQIGNYLMKLCSVSGVVMAQAEGSEGACRRLEGTAEFIRKTMPLSAAKMEPIQ